MNWFWWTIVALIALEPIMVILTIGDERKPRTRSDAAATLVVDALIIFGILYYTRFL